MFDSAGTRLARVRRANHGSPAHTFHEVFFDNLAKTLNVWFWEVFALLRRFEPLVRTAASPDLCWPGLGDVFVLVDHD